MPGLDTLDQGKGTLGGEEEKPVIENSEEGKKRFKKAEGIQAKRLLSTAGDLGDDAKTLVPYTKFFAAGYVGEEMDPVGGVLGNRAARSYGGLISHDAMTMTDFLYIDIGQEDDVEVGDRFIVYSQYRTSAILCKPFLSPLKEKLICWMRTTRVITITTCLLPGTM